MGGSGGGSGSGRDRPGPYPHLASPRARLRSGGDGGCADVGGEVGLREPGGVPCVACRFYNRRGRTGEDRPRHRRSKPVNSNWRSSVLRDALSSLVSSHVSSYSEQSAIWKGPIQRDKTDLAWLAVLFQSFIHESWLMQSGLRIIFFFGKLKIAEERNTARCTVARDSGSTSVTWEQAGPVDA